MVLILAGIPNMGAVVVSDFEHFTECNDCTEDSTCDYHLGYSHGYNDAYAEAYDEGRETLLYSIFGDLSEDNVTRVLRVAHKLSESIRTFTSVVRSLV